MYKTSGLKCQIIVSEWITLGLLLVSAVMVLLLQAGPYRMFTLIVLLNVAIVFIVLQRILRQLPRYETALYKRIEQDRLFAAIVRDTADAVIQLDLRGSVRAWNKSAALLFGYSEQAMLGQPFSMSLSNDDTANVEIRWLLDSTQRDGFIKRHETMCRDVNRRSFFAELTASLITGEDEAIDGISIILRDVTYRKQHEHAAEQQYSRLAAQSAQHDQELSEKILQLAEVNSELKELDQTRSEFVSLVSHQIRAPLTNMVGAIQTMQTNCAVASPACNRMLIVFEQQINRLDRLVQDVLNLTRIEQGGAFLHLEPISISPAIRQALQQISTRSSTHPIRFADKPGLPLVYADRDRIVEVLTNLLDNAHKYTASESPIFVDIRANQSEVTVSVRDSGPGLPDTDLERVFEKFYRVDSSDSQTSYGYGLGLYLCRRLIEAQQGRIWAENHPDGGAIFSFALPGWEE